MVNPHPAITFRVNLNLTKTETIGSATNQIEVVPLNPMRYQESQDQAVADEAQLKNLRVTWLPQINAASNIELKHGDEFTLYGHKALYVRDNYAIGYAPAERAVLDIV